METTTESTTKQTLGFQAEVKQLLHLVAHSLYSHKEIFLRELISNGADAIEKLRCAALNNNGLYEESPDPKIWIDFDKEKNTLTITDNGIGMSLEEARDNLGTIAQSGTRNFMSQLGGADQDSKTSALIGQFGVGFYSAFIVADKVTVVSRKAGLPKEKGVRWQSNGEGEFTLESVSRQQRGTEITLHLKEDQTEFVNDRRLREIIKRYSDHISTPILMHPVVKEDEDKEEDNTALEYETVNQAKALWMKSKSDITDEEYQQFYEYFAHALDKPLAWSHNHVEGNLEYTSLLYIPSQAPFDLWHREFQRGLKLYVQRVFIMDKAEELLPMYLRFVRGVIDSNDLPLNISRELLQKNTVIDKIRNACAKKILSLLESLSKNEPEKYATFWSQFGNVLKEGVAEDHSNKETIANLLRFTSTHENSNEQKVSFDDYINRMGKNQKKIYYLLADSYAAAKNNPHLEIFRKKGIEVLLFTDPVDEWLVMHLHELKDKTLQSITKGDMKVEEETVEDEQEVEAVKKAQEDNEKAYADILTELKKMLGDEVKEVRLSKRLTDSPSCVVQDENAIPKHMQQMFAAAGQTMPETKPILEINPEHTIVQNLQQQNSLEDWAHYLLDQAIIAEGGKPKDPAAFAKCLNRLLLGA